MGTISATISAILSTVPTGKENFENFPIYINGILVLSAESKIEASFLSHRV